MVYHSRVEKTHPARSEDRIESHKSIMIAVTTPTGYIGSQLVRHLLGATVGVIAHKSEKPSAQRKKK
jgi:hypothetical protein